MRRLWRWAWGTPPGRYALRVLLAVDQLGNALAGGDEDETISSRIGRAKLEALATDGYLNPLVAALDAVLEWLDPGHSVDAIEWSTEEVQEWLINHPNARLLLNRRGHVVGLKT